MIRNLFGGASKCRTVDVCDIFGDGSGKALYRLDGNANDESGNYHGTETAITYGGGTYERGGVFNGSSSVVDTAYPQPTGAFTISAWFKTSQTATYSILSSSNSGATAGVNFDVNSSKVRFGASGIMSTSLFSTTLVNDNVWRLATVTWDGTTNTNSLKLYINGVLEHQLTATSTTITASGVPFKIGKYGVLAYWFNGSIDQVRIFNRAITATEVATLYAECAPTSTVDNINPFEDGSLKALYQFNGDATDKTGTYNGTATNVTYGTGKFGQCAVFNGTAKIVYPFILQNIASSSFYFTSTAIANTQYLFSTNDGNSTGGGYLIYLYTSQLRIAISGTSGWLVALNIGPTLLSNTRYFVETQYDGSIFKVYLDGVLIYTSASIAMKASLVNARSGQDYGNTNGLSGTIDQLRIFNKALTPMEVASLYNETTPLEEPMHSLVDPFKDGSGKALYRLEGNALDESGNYNGTATSVTYGAGRFGRAGVFNGSSSYISNTINRNILIGGYSMSFWVTFNDIGTNRTLFSESNVNLSLLEITRVSSNALSLRMFTDGGTNIFSIPSTTLTSATLYHVVLIWDGTTTANAVKLYINNSLNNQGTASFTGSSIGNITGMFIGKRPDGLFHNGSLEQIRFFNRALTAGEVSTLFTEI